MVDCIPIQRSQGPPQELCKSQKQQEHYSEEDQDVILMNFEEDQALNNFCIYVDKLRLK